MRAYGMSLRDRHYVSWAGRGRRIVRERGCEDAADIADHRRKDAGRKARARAAARAAIRKEAE